MMSIQFKLLNKLMQIGETQLPTQIAVLFFLLIAFLIANVLLFKRGHESYSIKYELMRMDYDLFRTHPILVTGLLQFLYKLLFIMPVLLIIAIAGVEASNSLVDLPISLVNGLIILLIILSFKRWLYFYRMGLLWLLVISSQFINFFVQSESLENNYYELLCSIFYPINSILFCLALLTKEKNYCDIQYFIELAGLQRVKQKVKDVEGKEQDKQVSKVKIFEGKFIQVPSDFDGGLFSSLRKRSEQKINYKFIVLYLLSLCILGVNAVAIWETSRSVLGIIGLVTNFIYDLFIFAFNNLATPERSITNVFILVFVGRFLSFAFGEQLWIFGYCVLYFLVGTFVGQIIINDRLPLRNFHKSTKGRVFKDFFKTPEFVLFILTVEIVLLVTASSLGIASSRTNVSYSEEVAVPLWQFAVLMVGGTWIVILSLGSLRMFRRKQNKIREETVFYFGIKQIREYHIYIIVTYLMIIAVGLYCQLYLLNATALYTCIFLPLIILTLLTSYVFWQKSKDKPFSIKIQIASKIKTVKQESKKEIGNESQKEIYNEIEYDSKIRQFLPFLKSGWIEQQQEQVKKNKNRNKKSQQQRENENSSQNQSNQRSEQFIDTSQIFAALMSQMQIKQTLFDKYKYWIVFILTLQFIGLVLCTYFVAHSFFGIFLVICIITIISFSPFYRYLYDGGKFKQLQILCYQFGFGLGIVFWSIFNNYTGYAMVWAGLNLSLLALFIVYGLLRKFPDNTYLYWLVANFLLTVIFICLFLAFTVPPFPTILVSSFLFLTCLAAIPELVSDKKQTVKKIIWSVIFIAIIVLSICAFTLGFVSNFAVFTFTMGLIYIFLMAVGAIQFYYKQKEKYQSPHVYSAYGLPIFKFDSKKQAIKSSTSHKLFFDLGSATLIIYGSIVSLIYSSYNIAILVLAFYCCTSFFQNILFSIKTYVQLGQKKNKLTKEILVACLVQLQNKYMTQFKDNRQYSIVQRQKYIEKESAMKQTDPEKLKKKWRSVANLDFELIENKQGVHRLLYFWQLLVQFHFYTQEKAKMVTYINECQQIQKDLKQQGIYLQTLSLAFDFVTKYQLLMQQIQNLSPSKRSVFQAYQKNNKIQKKNTKMQQNQKANDIQKQQIQNDEKIFKNLQQQKPQSKEQKINQFNELLKKLGQKTKFQDLDFPHNEQSLGHLATVVNDWRRPKSKEDLIIGDISADDVRQGNIGDCYLISSLAVLGNKWILPALGIDPIKEEKRWLNQKGAYMIRFFKFGKEIFITVDDYLPVDQQGSFVFAKSQNQLELWPCILEKAYAKLYGGYQNIIEGQCHRVLSQLSGGVPFEILTKEFENNPYALWQKIIDCKENEYLMAAGSNSHELGDQACSSRNIVYGHAYSILDAREVQDNKLIKLKNPHGTGGKEWNGDFSDQSQYMNLRMMQILGYQKKDDGIFWMKLQDFMHEFRSLYVCKVFGDKFKKFTIDGEFTEQNSYGTPSKSDQTFRNPQYGITVKSQCTIFVNLTQEDALNNYQGKNFIFMRIQKTNGKRVSRHNKNQGVCGLPPKSKNTISVTTEVLLEADSYPYTFTLFISCADEGDTGKYKLQIYCSDKESRVIHDNQFDRLQF